MHKPVIVVGAFLMFGIVLLPAISGAFADAPTGTQTVEDESITISTDRWTAVSADLATSFYDNETVVYNGSVANESEYEWRTSDGSIRAVDGGELAAADRVEISYAYDVEDDYVVLGSMALWFVFGTIAVLTLVVGGMFVIGTFGDGSSGGGR